MRKTSSAKLQFSATGNATGISAFKIIKNYYPLPLKANHQVFSILTACQIFFSCLGALLLKIALWSKLFYESLSRYAEINIIDYMVDTRSLSSDEITNCPAERCFHLKSWIKIR